MAKEIKTKNVKLEEVINKLDKKIPSKTVNNTTNTKNDNKFIGVQLNVPLYSGGATQSQIRTYVAKLEQAKEQYELTADSLKTQIQKESGAPFEPHFPCENPRYFQGIPFRPGQ